MYCLNLSYKIIEQEMNKIAIHTHVIFIPRHHVPFYRKRASFRIVNDDVIVIDTISIKYALQHTHTHTHTHTQRERERDTRIIHLKLERSIQLNSLLLLKTSFHC